MSGKKRKGDSNSQRKSTGKSGISGRSDKSLADQGGTSDSVSSEDYLVVSYKWPVDPSPDKLAEAVRRIESCEGAKIVRVRPGMLKVAVASGKKEKAASRLKDLQDWDVSEEAVASMPVGPSRFSSS